MQVALAQVERLGSAEAVAALRELAAAAAPAGVPLELLALAPTLTLALTLALPLPLTLTLTLPLTLTLTPIRCSAGAACREEYFCEGWARGDRCA